MEEFTEMLKEEMSLLDDRESQKGQELRKELGIDGLDEKELLKYKIDFIVKHMGYGNLYCLERNDYFRELLISCIDKESAQCFTPTTITCITSDSKPRIFWVFTDNDDKTKIIYSIYEDGDISKISQEDVKQQFANGMRTLSKSRENELKEILLGDDEKTTIFEEDTIQTAVKKANNPKKVRGQDIAEATMELTTRGSGGSKICDSVQADYKGLLDEKINEKEGNEQDDTN